MPVVNHHITQLLRPTCTGLSAVKQGWKLLRLWPLTHLHAGAWVLGLLFRNMPVQDSNCIALTMFAVACHACYAMPALQIAQHEVAA